VGVVGGDLGGDVVGVVADPPSSEEVNPDRNHSPRKYGPGWEATGAASGGVG
jgi:hypothetical protein